MNSRNITIIGGGPAGLLLALKLSKTDSDFLPHNITLIEANSSLGGRCYFTTPTRTQNTTSGPGWELQQPETQEAFYRHIFSHLSEHEQNTIEIYCQEQLNNKQDLGLHTLQSPSHYFVKKEFTPLAALCLENSELFTKKESESLSNLIIKAKQIVNAAENEPLNSTIGKWDPWQSLAQTHKDAIKPLIKAISFTENIEKLSLNPTLFSIIQQLTIPTSIKYNNSMLRIAKLEHIIADILKARGVNLLLNTRVTKVTTIDNANLSKKQALEIHFVTENEATHNKTQCEVLCLAVSLAESLKFLQRQFLTGKQSQFANKVRPRSMIALELYKFSEIKGEHCPKSFEIHSHLWFPSEGCQGRWLSSDVMLLYGLLDFETSLQASAVKEILQRLRKAARRLVSSATLNIWDMPVSFQSSTVASISERIVLVPTWESVPSDCTPLDIKDVCAAQKGILLCGDSFGAFTDPWRGIIESINETTHQITKQLEK